MSTFRITCINWGLSAIFFLLQTLLFLMEITKHVHNQSKNEQVPEYYFKNNECKTKRHYIWHMSCNLITKKGNHSKVTKCRHRQGVWAFHILFNSKRVCSNIWFISRFSSLACDSFSVRTSSVRKQHYYHQWSRTTKQSMHRYYRYTLVKTVAL